MDSLRTRPRPFAAIALALSATVAGFTSFGCSSNGSAFGTGGTGADAPAPSGSSGSATTDPGSGAGSSSGPSNSAGNGAINPTGAMGGDSNTGAGGTGNTPQAGSGPTGGVATTGGASTSGGTVAMGGAPSGGSAPTGGSSTSGGSDAGPPCPKPAGQICHEFIANDNGRNVVNYVNEFTSKKAGAVEWSTAVGSTGANSPRTIEIVDNAKAAGGKAVMVSVNTGYVEIDLSNGTKLLEVKAQNITNVTGACRLTDGTTALGTDTNPAKITIVNASGVPSTSFNLPTGANLRAINLDRSTGHYWLSRTETVYELNAQGQVLWQASMGAGTKGYAVWWREGGGAYATTGEPATVVEIDASKKILATIGGRDNAAFDAYQLDFFSGFVRTKAGTYVVANWLGHLGTPGQDTPEVIEFQPDGASGKVIWTWGNQTLARQITNVYVLR